MKARRRRRALLIAAIGALALPATAAADGAGTVTAAAGPTSATLSWKAAMYGVADPHLAIVRAGAPLFDGSPVADVKECTEGCSFPGVPLHVIDLDGDGEPEVLVDAYTGGAHCCVVSEILRFTGTGYSGLEAFWGDPGYRLRDLDGDGRPELVSADDAFAYAFSSYAASFLPPYVVDYDPTANRGLRDVTRRFPALIRKNLREALHLVRRARRQHYETLGVVAAYVADLYLLGRGREVHGYLARARRRGDLRNISGPAPRRFERELLSFLHKQGYR
jgi:hypothetical protein